MNELLNIVNEFDAFAVIGLALVVVLIVLRSNRNVKDIKDNHLGEIVSALNRIEEKLEKMNDCIIWMKSRMNGKRK